MEYCIKTVPSTVALLIVLILISKVLKVYFVLRTLLISGTLVFDAFTFLRISAYVA
jgi:hypothetical protein